MAFKSFSKNNPCPVCNSGSKGCSVSDDAINPLHMCRGDVISDSFKFIKNDKNNLFGIYVPKENYKGKDADNGKKFSRAEIEAYKKQQAELEQQRLNALLTVEERHVKISALLGELKLLKRHQKDLEDRKYSGDFSEFGSIRKFQILASDLQGLPGFTTVKGKTKYVGTTGMVCAIKNAAGQFTGFQVKSDKPEATGKYVWTNHVIQDSEVKISAHLRNGELPINVLLPAGNSELGFCEGTLKPIVAASRLNINLVGEAIVGGQPLQLKDTLDALKPNKCVIYPDAGYVANSQVLGRLILLAELLVSLDQEIAIADWYHGFNKNLPDIDERKSLEGLRFLTLEDIRNLSEGKTQDYFLGSEFSKEIQTLTQNVLELVNKAKDAKGNIKVKSIELENKNYNWQDFSAGNLPSYQVNHDLCYEIEKDAQDFYQEALAKGYKTILDISQTGSGKTHDAARLDVSACFEELPKDKNSIKYFHISQSPKKANNEKLVTDFTLLPTRHGDLTYDAKKLDIFGNPVAVPSKANEKVDIASNCHLLDFFTSVRSTKTEADPCSFCVFQKKCKKGAGNGYGYKNQASRAFKANKLRANILGISEDMVTHNSIMVVDEYNQSVPWIEELEITFQDFKDSIFYLNLAENTDEHTKAIRLLKEIAQLLIVSMDAKSREKYRAFVTAEIFNQKQISFYGESFEFIKARISEVTREDLEKSVAFIEQQISEYNNHTLKGAIKTKKSLEATSLLLQKNWLKSLSDLLTGTNPFGALRIVNGVLVLSTRHQRMLNILQNAYGVVYQDATGSKLDLALKLGINESEILVVRKKFDKPDNVKVTQVKGFGRASNMRSDELIERLHHFRNKVTALHSDAGFIEFKRHSLPGDLLHFVDGRGSNAFKTKKAVASIGIPCSNLSNKLSEYQCYIGKSASLNDKTFQAFVNKEVSSELVQEVGRLRANRRKDEQLNYYVAGDCDLTFLRQLGFDVTEVEAVDFDYRCGDSSDKAIKAIKQALSVTSTTISELTQKEVTEKTQISQRKLSYIAKKFGGWDELKSSLSHCLDVDNQHFQSVSDIDYVSKLSEEVVSANLKKIFQENLEVELLDGVNQPTQELKQAIFNRLLNQDRTELLVQILNHLPTNN